MSSPARDPFAAQPPLLDRAVLQKLRDNLGTDAEEQLKELLQLFLTDSLSLLAVMREATRTGDAKKLKQAAHTLRSTAAAFGSPELARLCQELEKETQNADTSRWMPMIDTVENLYHRVAAEVRAELQRLA